ncbi:MAG: peptidoglycan binding domain-containing protein, partial [Anaerolineae bacterium]
MRWGWIVAWWMICLAAAALIAAPLVYQLRYAGRIIEGVEVAGIALGGLTPEAATTVLRNRLATFPASASVILRYDTRTWTLSPAELGVTIDVRATAMEAYRVGRRGAGAAAPLDGLRLDLSEQWRAWRSGHQIAPILRVDENRLALVLKQIAREIDQAPREATLNITEAGVVATTSAKGRAVNLDAAREAVLALLRAGRGGVIALTVEERSPAIFSADAAAAQANAALSHPFTLAIQASEGVASRPIGRETLGKWLTLVPRPGPEGVLDLDVRPEGAAVRTYVADLARQLDRPAQDAVLDYDVAAKQVIVVRPSRPGRALDVDAATQAISQTLAGLLDLAPNAPVTVPLSLQPIKPRIDSSDLSALGIRELVTQGTTYFAGSSPERVHNIVTAAQKFVGVVIPPGEEFSFNRY